MVTDHNALEKDVKLFVGVYNEMNKKREDPSVDFFVIIIDSN